MNIFQAKLNSTVCVETFGRETKVSGWLVVRPAFQLLIFTRSESSLLLSCLRLVLVKMALAT